MEETIFNNIDQLQFEIQLQNEKALMDYRIHDGKIYLMNTRAPEVYKGKGLGAKLIEHALNYAKENNLELVAYCSYARSYLEKKNGG